MTAVAERVTSAEYLRLERAAERKHELRGGRIVEMPGVTRAHSQLQGRLALICVPATDQIGCEYNGSDLKVRVEEDRYLYPDGTIACEPRFEDGVRDVLLNPLVIFEILCPSTEGYDRGEKFHRYGHISALREIVLIASDTVCVDVFARAEDGWSVRTYSNPEVTVNLTAISLNLPLSDLYRNVLDRSKLSAIDVSLRPTNALKTGPS